ncbi:MAG: response regulator [Methanothrix sp.]|nr:MAG: response regulator [Methanothrix sp.]
MTNKSGKPEDLNTLLLVEDDEAHAALIRRLLDKDNNTTWDIHHVINLKDALEWIKENKNTIPFLVIADFRLPDGNGLDLAADAKHPINVGFPLIILTGFGSEKIAARAFKSGAMDYVVKDANSLQMLPKIAKRTLYKWAGIAEYKHAEDYLRTYIKDLENEDSKLEELMDKVSTEIESSLGSFQTLNDLLAIKCADVLDDDDWKHVHELNESIKRTDTLFEAFFERLLPLSFDISLVRLYNAKMQKSRAAESKAWEE